MSDASITLISKAGRSAGAIATDDGIMTSGWPLSEAAQEILAVTHRTDSLEQVLDRLCTRLNQESHMDLIRVTLGLPTYDPKIMSHVYFWTPDNGGEASTRSHAVYTSGQYQNSALPKLYRDGVGTRVCFAKGETHNFGIEADLKAAGATDYLILPLAFHDGIGGHVGWATQQPGGWTDTQIATLNGITSLLGLRADGIAQANSLYHITRTYLGRRPSNQVMSGAVRQGVDHEITAAIWYCDLRGFTTFSDSHSPAETWAMLDQYFNCMVPAITKWGGDIIKIIGDAVLAIFEIGPTTKAESAHYAALLAAQDARRAMAAVNEERIKHGLSAIEAGIAVHHGTLHLGNIGADDRLDFTVIGPAVNEVTRIEELCRPLKKPFLATKTFVDHCSLVAAHLDSIGHHALKGVIAPRELFTDVRWQLQPDVGQPDMGQRRPDDQKEAISEDEVRKHQAHQERVQKVC